MNKIFPSLDAVKKGIDELKKIPLEDVSDIDLQKNLLRYFHTIPYSYCSINEGETIFRARKNKDKLNSYQSIDDLYVPPKNLLTKYGRANKPYQRIFYGSSNLKLAVFEILQDELKETTEDFVDKVVTFSYWKERKSCTS